MDPELQKISQKQQHITLNKNINIIVQHMEEYLYTWCLYQYLQMKKYLANTSCNLIITNAKIIYQYKGKHQLQNKQNLQKLIKQFETCTGGSSCKLVFQSVVQLVESHKLDQPVCMLDMRGEKQLNPSENWATLIFGGILGDHPPRDRPAPVRKYFQNIRHLGDLQLATDTAVLITRLIMNNKLNLGSIPLIKQPTIKGNNSKGEKTTVQMEGFSYVSKELDISSGKLQQNLSGKQKKQIYMSEGVKNLLIQQDLSADGLM